eukprot:jgi/Botrbrau1/17655/Bobra.0166s0083.1
MHSSLPVRAQKANLNLERSSCDELLRKRLRLSSADAISHAAATGRQKCLRHQYSRSDLKAKAVIDEAADLHDIEKQVGIGGSSPQRGGSDSETDVVIIGSGIGGLCCGALLARYGYRVTVCESHYLPGGAAHSFETNGYQFDAGPSFFAGISGPIGKKTANPLKQVLDAIGETVECRVYDSWMTYTPEGVFRTVCDAEQYRSMILRQGGPEALQQWRALEREMEPLQRGAALFPAAALRGDWGALLSVARFGPALLSMGMMAGKLTGPFSNIVDKVVTNKWLRDFIDLECFVLSGMLAKDTITAEMAFMFMERNSGTSTIDYPLGGSRAIVDALVRGLQRYGGPPPPPLSRGPHPHGRRQSGGSGPEKGQYKEGAQTPDAGPLRQVITDGVPGASRLRTDAARTPMTKSFMHLHLGINAEGLPPDLDCHHLFVNSWDDLEAPQNVCIASIPSVFSPHHAPEGKAVVHAYTAGNEPYSIWENLERNTAAYRNLKEERSQVLWQSLERVIPDIRERAELVQVGTPLTHERFLNRHRGTYGPAISAASSSFPGPNTPIKGLYRCGDSCQPGIGIPAAAASGMICANTLAPVWDHLRLLDALAL